MASLSHVAANALPVNEAADLLIGVNDFVQQNAVGWHAKFHISLNNWKFQ